MPRKNTNEAKSRIRLPNSWPSEPRLALRLRLSSTTTEPSQSKVGFEPDQDFISSRTGFRVGRLIAVVKDD